MKITVNETKSLLKHISLAGIFALIALVMLYLPLELVTPVVENASTHMKDGTLRSWLTQRLPTWDYSVTFAALTVCIIFSTILGLFAGMISKVLTGIAHDELKNFLKNSERQSLARTDIKKSWRRFRRYAFSISMPIV